MYILGEDVPDVIYHCEATSVVCIFPGDIGDCIFISFPIDFYGVVLLDHRSKVIGVEFSNVFDPKVINYNTE